MRRNTDPRHQSWRGMIQRCRNPNAKQYKDYGGRGITYDPSWSSFTRFAEDMGPRPEGHTLDRLDNDGPYCKTNCVWRTRRDQMNNMRRNFVVEHAGQTKTCTEWARAAGVNPRTLHDRLYKLGWTPEEAIRAL